MMFSLQLNAAGETELSPGLVNPGYHEKPDWFKISFLDLYEDIEDAADNGKRVMVYMYQDGCPYCKKLLEDNFGQRNISEKTRKYFDVVPINIWGDREVTVGDTVLTEKVFAEKLRVQYTPTLIMFNDQNKVVYRANGYYPPEKFNAMLDYVGQKMETTGSFQDYLAKVDPKPSTGKLHTDVATIIGTDLKNSRANDKYLLVMFEQEQCSTCDELHLDILERKESKELIKRFDVAVLDMWSEDKITTPDGQKKKVKDWVKQLDIKYAPSLVYFNGAGEEVFRSDAYLRAFHTQSIMDYVSTHAYKDQKNFQRYIDGRADHLREQGIEVNLMD